MATEWSFGCLAAYLAISGIALIAGGHVALAALHMAGVALCIVVWRRARYGVRSTAWVETIPLFLWPLLYFELPALIALFGAIYHDQRVQSWELALFHAYPSRILASRLSSQPLSELLHAGYLAYYPAIFLPPLRLLSRGDRRALSQTILALGVTYACCWIIFAIFPVEGPRYLWPAPAGIPDGPIRRLTTQMLASGSSRGAAFPSSHMAIATVQSVMATRWQPRIAALLWLVAALIGVSAVYGGFHYAVDMIAGLALGLAVGVSLAASRTPATL